MGMHEQEINWSRRTCGTEENIHLQFYLHIHISLDTYIEMSPFHKGTSCIRLVPI